MLKFHTTLYNVNRFTEKLYSTEGTVGLLMNDRGLYDNINNTIGDADKLIIDLTQNPKRYVHFSLFGNSAERRKQDKRSAEAAKNENK